MARILPFSFIICVVIHLWGKQQTHVDWEWSKPSLKEKKIH